MKNEFIAVIDCNNFFVSCERVFRPDLEGKPVMVLSSNDGCAVARSQEVKDMAIPMGIAVFEIKDIIKDKEIVLFSSNFTLYRDFSRRVFAIVKSAFTHFEQYSIDEAFIYLGAIDKRSAVKQAIALKQTIFKQTGIPVSIGIGHTKTQAKLASTNAKRDPLGTFVCDEEWWSKNANEVAIGDIWGVGRQLRERYQKHGIYTVADLRQAPASSLQSFGGVVSTRLQLELSSNVVYKVEPSNKLPKSVISSRSFGTAVTEKSVLLSALTHHLHSVVADLEDQKLVAATVSIYLEERREADRRKYKTLKIPLDLPTRNITVLLREMYALMDINFTKSDYKKAGVMAGGLMQEHYVPQTLFDSVDANKQSISRSGVSTAHALMYELQKKFKNGAMTIGTNNRKTQWKSRQERCSPAYTTDWSKLCVVKA